MHGPDIRFVHNRRVSNVDQATTNDSPADSALREPSNIEDSFDKLTSENYFNINSDEEMNGPLE